MSRVEVEGRDADDAAATPAPAPTPAPLGATAAPRIRLLAAFGNELTTLFRRWRTIALLSALAAVPVLIAVAVRVTQGRGGGTGGADELPVHRVEARRGHPHAHLPGAGMRLGHLPHLKDLGPTERLHDDRSAHVRHNTAGTGAFPVGPSRISRWDARHQGTGPWRPPA